MREYTPTTEELRTRLAELTERAEAARNKYANRVSGPAFDRWLEGVRAEERRRVREALARDILSVATASWHSEEYRAGMRHAAALVKPKD